MIYAYLQIKMIIVLTLQIVTDVLRWDREHMLNDTVFLERCKHGVYSEYSSCRSE